MLRSIPTLLIALSLAVAPACALDGSDQPAGSPDETATGQTVAPPITPDGWTLSAADTATLADSAAVGAVTPAVDTSGSSCAVITKATGGACPSGFSCLYQNNNRAGFGVGVSDGCVVLNLTQISCGGCTNGIHGNNGTFNDQMSSWQNASGSQACWWFNINRGGTKIVMPNGVTHNSVESSNNDEASSFGSC